MEGAWYAIVPTAPCSLVFLLLVLSLSLSLSLSFSFQLAARTHDRGRGIIHRTVDNLRGPGPDPDTSEQEPQPTDAIHHAQLFFRVKNVGDSSSTHSGTRELVKAGADGNHCVHAGESPSSQLGWYVEVRSVV